MNAILHTVFTDHLDFPPVTAYMWHCFEVCSDFFPRIVHILILPFAETLQRRARDIAKTYQADKERWIEAAEKIRQPYWDYALNAVPPAEVLTQKHLDYGFRWTPLHAPSHSTLLSSTVQSHGSYVPPADVGLEK